MVYRIRYCDRTGTRSAEAVVEAGSPTEALVKFCHTGDHCQDPATVQQRVTSVCPDADPLPPPHNRAV